ncbi:MAG: hypothetical protein BWY71_00375 [Planctomycetes bacterium ADurb.Bin412]|nr:MAG: hypothetical protein BWY71_00375 [Planctomycetes bacterium ADurb.Bin412]
MILRHRNHLQGDDRGADHQGQAAAGDQVAQMGGGFMQQFEQDRQQQADGAGLPDEMDQGPADFLGYCRLKKVLHGFHIIFPLFR